MFREVGGSIRWLVPRAASAPLDPSSNIAATKIEGVGFIGFTSIV
jgi:hypothetical protein